MVLQHGKQDDGPLAILGAGTGLGMARGLRTGQGLQALASEGGTVNSPPATRLSGSWPAG